MIFRFGYKVMGFRDLSKLLAIALKSSISNLQRIETNFVHFSYKIVNLVFVAYFLTLCINERKNTVKVKQSKLFSLPEKDHYKTGKERTEKKLYQNPHSNKHNGSSSNC